MKFYISEVAPRMFYATSKLVEVASLTQAKRIASKICTHAMNIAIYSVDPEGKPLVPLWAKQGDRWGARWYKCRTLLTLDRLLEWALKHHIKDKVFEKKIGRYAVAVYDDNINIYRENHGFAKFHISIRYDGILDCKEYLSDVHKVPRTIKEFIQRHNDFTRKKNEEEWKKNWGVE